MVDDRRRDATYKKGNVTTGGRYGEAEGDRPHMEPEVPPRGMESAAVDVPESLAGDLPENRTKRAGEPQEQDERAE